MVECLSFLLLNPFSWKWVDENSKCEWLKNYSLNFSWWANHFLREVWVWKKLDMDEDKLKNLFEWFESFYSLINESLKKDTSIHMIIPLNLISIYFHFLNQWELGNKIFLHLVCSNLSEDLKSLENLEKVVEKNQSLVIASLLHENTIFNDNVNRREIQKWYDEIVFSQTQTSISAIDYLRKCIDEWKTFFNPVSFIDAEPFNDWDICLIWEIDQEKIAGLTKAFEVSICDEKRWKFNNFNSSFIVKNLPNLKLFVVKTPYYLYENNVLFEKDNLETLPQLLSQNEIRLLQLWDKKHLKLLNKYFNWEKWVVYDWHKKLRCEDKTNEKGEMMVSSNELILKNFSDEIWNYELTMISLEDDWSYLDKYLRIVRENGRDCIIVSLNEKIVFSTLDFWKKVIDSCDIYQLLCKSFGI